MLSRPTSIFTETVSIVILINNNCLVDTTISILISMLSQVRFVKYNLYMATLTKGAS